MKPFYLLLILLPQIIHAQRGVQFRNLLSWKEIVAAAKHENKYIFIDCYATWCVSCREMDKNVYTDATVGDFMNRHFISVKLQMDSTAADRLHVKKMYRLAREICTRYHVEAFPTYLFFDPSGKLVHKEMGMKESKVFLATAAGAMDPDKQYYTLVRKAKRNEISGDQLPLVIDLALTFREDADANWLMRRYLHDYIYNLPEKEVLDSGRLVTMARFMTGIKEKGYRIFFKYKDTIDKITHRPGFAHSVIKNVITRELIHPLMQTATSEKVDPDWKSVKTALAGTPLSYDEQQRLLIQTQVSWYNTLFAKNNIDLQHATQVLSDIDFSVLKEHGIDTSGTEWLATANFIEFAVLGYSNDENLLRESVRWIEQVMQVFPGTGFSYVYGGLMYRLGFLRQALEWQQLTLNLIEYSIVKGGRNPKEDAFFRIHTKILDAMKAGHDIRPLIRQLYSLDN